MQRQTQMLSAALRRRLLFQPARCYAQAAAAAAASVNAPAPTPRLAYHVPRNTRGSIPVYTDQVNTKYLTLVRNVEGDAQVSPPAPVSAPSES